VDIKHTKLGIILTEEMVYPCALHKIPKHDLSSSAPFSAL